MKYFGFAVALVVLVMSVILLRAELRSMDDERSEWHTERDSLRRGWEATLGELRAQRDTTDALRAYTDSMVFSFPPQPVIIRKALKAFEFAPLQTAIDTLNAE